MSQNKEMQQHFSYGAGWYGILALGSNSGIRRWNSSCLAKNKV